ncbi:uncharacterized protein Dsimw501_GD28361 [Drosophila simulans]|nr:uncharacterized protein Dsimw501_GD28361 [Drosophila simulans]
MPEMHLRRSNRLHQLAERNARSCIRSGRCTKENQKAVFSVYLILFRVTEMLLQDPLAAPASLAISTAVCWWV